ncbi:MAG: protein kinase [Bacilli bacterium]|nr:protein kinase [Bacilli bacterium]MBQ2981833.1 protein kinase [Lachnospiraceae bacterium]
MNTDDNLNVNTAKDNAGKIKTVIEEKSEVDVKENNKILAELIQNKIFFISDKDVTYTYKNIVSLDGGEGIVIECYCEQYGEVAVKIYVDIENVSFEKREKIIKFTNMEGADKYVLPIIDKGYIELSIGKMNYFEVQPLCREGNLLSKGKRSYNEIVGIVKEINEALHFVHTNGFLHMDIKPENIYQYNNHIVLGDFGITREMKDGKYVTRVTHMGKQVGGTLGYQSPEAEKAYAFFKLTPKTDYYSLGVTIATLYVGHFVFFTNGEFDGEKYQESYYSGHIELGNKEDKRTLLLQNLIDGLFQFDAKNRFDYEDVCKWLEDPFYKGKTLNSNKSDIEWSSPFQGSEKKELIYTEKELLMWMVNNWDEAIKRLYRGHFEEHFKRNNKSYVSQELQKIVDNKYPDLDIDGDLALFEACMLVYSELDTPLVWKGRKWESLQKLADEIIEASDIAFYKILINNKVISKWINVINLLENEHELKELILNIENAAEVNEDIACYWFAYIFATEKFIIYNNTKYMNPIELIEGIIDKPNELYKKNGYLEYILDLKKGCKLLGFMCSGGDNKIGCDKFVLQFIKEMPAKLSEQVHLFFCMVEKITEEFNNMQLLDKIRRAYLFHGPYGDINYVHFLIKNTKDYCSSEKKGKEIIDTIKKMPQINISSINLMGKELLQIKTYIDLLIENMQNNPVLVEAGIYNGKVIKCRNLRGYFLYRFLDREVAIGYKDIIEKER